MYLHMMNAELKLLCLLQMRVNIENLAPDGFDIFDVGGDTGDISVLLIENMVSKALACIQEMDVAVFTRNIQLCQGLETAFVLPYATPNPKKKKTKNMSKRRNS